MSREHHGDTFGFVATMAGCSVSLGLIVISGTVLVVDALRSAGEANLNLILYLLFGGTLAGILVAGGAAWQLLRPVQSAYRRGGLTMVCAFATVIVMLICIPIHQLLGQLGLVALILVCGLASALLARRGRRLGAGA